MLDITKMIGARVKTQSRSQNDLTWAMKWGIVCLSSLNSFEDAIKYLKKMSFPIVVFLYKSCKIAIENLEKCENSKIDTCFRDLQYLKLLTKHFDL